MTGPQEIFRRIRGQGWLVLAGGAPTLGRPYPRLAEHLLDHTDLSQPCTILVSGHATHKQEQFLEDVDVLLDSHVQLRDVEAIPHAPDLGSGLLALLGGEAAVWLETFAKKGLEVSLLSSLTDGGVVLAAPEASQCFGSWAFPRNAQDPARGLGWLPGAAVIAGETDPADDVRVRHLFKGRERVYALGLPTAAILALGPEGQVEVWSDASPRVALGKGWA